MIKGKKGHSMSARIILQQCLLSFAGFAGRVWDGEIVLTNA